MEEKLCKKAEEKLKALVEQDINNQNIDIIYKLYKIRHMIKEEDKMNYGNYGARPGYNAYGNYGEYNGSYGRRGYDAKYRGHEYLDRIGDNYGRYMDSRERYGNNEETNKSQHYMVESLKDFIRYLFEEAETPQQKQKIREAIQQSIM